MAGVHYGAGMTADVDVKPKRRTALWIALAGIAVLLVAGAVGAYALGGEAAEPGSITVTGQLELTGSGIAFGDTTGECVGDGGYDDLHEGTQIVITDAAGKTIAVGALGEGKPDALAGTINPKPKYCAFQFEITAPGGHDFYGVAIGKRGSVQYAASTLAKPLRLSLS